MGRYDDGVYYTLVHYEWVTTSLKMEGIKLQGIGNNTTMDEMEIFIAMGYDLI